jgi:hypothetical protein
MNEPSVLDYIKEKLIFWRKGSLKIPTLEEIRVEQPGSENQDLLQPSFGPELPSLSQLPAFPAFRLPDITEIHLPWRALIGFVLALIAQRSLEPPQTDTKTAVIFYVLAFILVIWSFITKEWRLAELPVDEPSTDEFKFRWEFILAVLPLGIFTYVLFSSGKFTLFNVILWILTVAAFIIAVAVINKSSKEWIERLWKWLISWPKQVNINPWILLLVAATVIMLFFRIYHLQQVPPEMTSDHAEKLLDITDVLNGQYSVFFQRNTGREAIQFYLTALIIKLFHTGISFISLKIGTTAAGLAILPFIYLIGKELGNKRAGFLAMFLAGIAYWPNVISRVGLRFALYPLFVAPFMYFFLKGIRRKNRNDIIWAGIFLGMGMHGYSPFRIVPFLAVVGILIYLIGNREKQNRLFAGIALGILAILAFAIFLPLFRYTIDHPDIIIYRTLTRITGVEQPLVGSPVKIFFSNLWNAMMMFGYSDGDTWLHSIPFYPALDIISAALFYIGFILLLVRSFLHRKWQDIFMVLSIPILLLPSILSLAFPIENPSLNRTAGAIVPTFVIIGLALDGFLQSIDHSLPGKTGKLASGIVAVFLLLFSMNQNYKLVFDTYLTQYTQSAGNTAALGRVIRDYADSFGSADTAWIVGYPYWLDTRLPSITAGYPIKDYAIWPNQFKDTLTIPGPKLFILNQNDVDDLNTLKVMYPSATIKVYEETVQQWNYVVMFVPGQ